MRNEQLRLLRVWDSVTLIRSGYYACHNCGAHNYSYFSHCLICGETHWRLKVPTELISMGPPTTLLQNVVYALPAVKVTLFCQTVAATFQQSNTVDFAVNGPVTLSADGMAEVSGGFIRCTSGNVVVTLKRA